MQKKIHLTDRPGEHTQCAECPIREKALFQVLSDDYIHDAQSRRTAQYAISAREHLYEEGDKADMAFTLFQGWLLLYRSHSDGSRQGLRVALPGDFVAFSPLTDSAINHSALALTDCVMCGFQQQDLHEMLHTHPPLTMQVATIQARDAAQCHAAMLGLGRKSAEQRIAHLLVELFHRLKLRGQVDANTSTMPFPLTQEVIGDLTGLTPVHTNRVMQKLRADGMISCERKQLVLLDLDKMHELGEFMPSDAA